MHQNKYQNKHTEHLPVLLEPVLQYLKPQSGEAYLDLTAGYGGHAAAILGKTGNFADSVLVDRDEQAMDELRQQFTTTGLTLLHQDFLSASQELADQERRFDLILADLGVSSPHLNEGKRGFAIQESARLDMRMDQRQILTAETIVNTYDQAELTDILRRFGEEPKAHAIAAAIIRDRPVTTTDQLAAIAARAWPGHSRVHPATRTFQALRIAVNDELGLLERALPLWQQLLAPGGRLAVVSFHSLEDRLVKQSFAEASGDRYDAELQVLTKSPATATPQEIAFNPRARSAKLRVAVKIKMKGNAHANSG